GWDYPQLIAAGMDPAVVHAEMSFQQPAALDDELGIAVSCMKLGHTSFEMAYRVTRSGESGAGEEPIARARIVYVNFDPESRRKRPVPDVFRAPLLESQGTAVKPREDR
ncbi:MAG: acyl-CoA thioesterase, partial [Micromonosporaceae bacterium]